MGKGTLYLGPLIADLSKVCYSDISVGMPPSPEEVLIVGQNGDAQQRLIETWDQSKPPIAATVTTLADVVDRWVEASAGPTLLLDTITRRRLIENALSTVSQETSSVSDPQTLVTSYTRLLTAFEDGRLTSTEMLSDALDETALSETTRESLMGLFDAYLDQQATHLDPVVSSQADQYEAVIGDPEAFTAAFPDVHTVVFEGFFAPTELQWQLIESIPDEIQVEALLPYPEWDETAVESGLFVKEPASLTSNGTLETTIERFEKQGFDSIPVTPPESCGISAARQMYHSISDAVELAPSIRWRERPSPREEVRTVARDIRESLNKGVQPESMTVVVPGMLSYREYLIELFDAYRIPYTIRSNKALEQTLVGSAVRAIVALGGAQPDVSQLVDLLTNPLVRPDEVNGIEHPEVEAIHRTVSATHDQTVETVIEHFDGAAGDDIAQLFESCQRLSEREPTEAIADLRTLFTELGLDTAIETLADRDNASFDTAMETQAYESIQRQLDSVLATVDPANDRTGREAIQTALSTMMVAPPPQSTDDAVEIIGLRDTIGRCFDHAVLLGALDDHLPTRSERPAFFERVYDEIDTIDVRDEFAHARYLTRLLIANCDNLLITTPAETVDGEPLLNSPILAELRRVTDLDADTASDERITTDLEVHRSIGEQTDPVDAAHGATEAGCLSTTSLKHITTGAKLASARAAPDSSEYVGRVDAEVVGDLPRLDPSAPISPSRLNTYAKCGFRYFASHGLDLSEPESIEPIPDRAMLGTLIHEVLRETFERFQERPGEPVTLTSAKRTTVESTLLKAAQHVIETPTRGLLAEFNWGTDAAFARQQLEELFTGVGTAAENPYHRTDYPHDGVDRGLFARFLDSELARDSAPSYFEYPFGGVENSDADATEHIEIATPRGTARLRGQIDRIDRVSNGEGPDEVTVWDYKSGSTPSTARTTDGTDFQLATYLRAAVAGLDGDISVVDGHYYEVSPPGTVNTKDGLSEEFESEAEFEAFLDAEYPARLAQLQTALEQGAFQPTYLDEKEAGCEYCAYRSACDVRHHRRHDRLDELDDDHAEYVPPGVADGGPFQYAPDATPSDPEDDE